MASRRLASNDVANLWTVHELNVIEDVEPNSSLIEGPIKVKRQSCRRSSLRAL